MLIKIYIFFNAICSLISNQVLPLQKIHVRKTGHLLHFKFMEPFLLRINTAFFFKYIESFHILKISQTLGNIDIATKSEVFSCSGFNPWSRHTKGFKNGT